MTNRGGGPRNDLALRGRQFVIWQSGYILAFDHVTFFANGRVAWVEEMMVTPGWRRGGVGRKLMETVEQWARERGARLVAMATRRAASFYRGVGYEESAVYFRKLL